MLLTETVFQPIHEFSLVFVFGDVDSLTVRYSTCPFSCVYLIVAKPIESTKTALYSFFECADEGITICLQLKSQPTEITIVIVTLKNAAIVEKGNREPIERIFLLFFSFGDVLWRATFPVFFYEMDSFFVFNYFSRQLTVLPS